MAFELMRSVTIEEFKRQIQAKGEGPVEEQILLYGGRQLEDTKTLADCQVSHTSTVQVVYRLLGD